MYEWVTERLDKAASSNMRSPTGRAKIHPAAVGLQHNLQYWRNQPYLGFGAGAHGYAAGIAWPT